MKFNTKAIHGGQHPDPSTSCNATHISNNDLCTNKPWTMGNMNTVELQTPHEQL
jgi:hypothetical protein